MKTLTMRIMRIKIAYRGDAVKRSELERKLKRGGWVIISGGKHNIAYHPDNPTRKTTVPRGSTINIETAKGILRFAGLL